MALRYDIGSVSKVERTDQGYLRCDAAITRVGVFGYRNGDGTVRRELRLPEEVFARDALDSFALAPLTNNHPRVKLTSENTAKFQAGTIANPHEDGANVAARVQVTDQKTIDDVEGGKTQLSCGYRADVEAKSGVTSGIPGIEDGLSYDAIQRNIRGNHVALVDVGRAGPDVALRLDHDDAVQTTEKNTKRARPTEKATMKLQIDGITVEIEDQAAQLVKKAIATRDDALGVAETEAKKAKTDLAAEKARADKASEDLAAEEKAHKDATDPKVVRKHIDARLELERQASEILGKDAKVDAMTDAEIKSAVVLKTSKDPETTKKRLDGCDETYLAVRYDAAIEGFVPGEAGSSSSTLAAVRSDANSATDRADSDKARARMIEATQKAGSEPLRA